jgi:glycosyltransferase involved in cell wall biosynthesis
VTKPKRKTLAIISPGFLPVPAVRGGAIELFIEKTLPYLKKHFEVTVFSIADSQLKNNRDYVYIQNNDLKRVLFSIKHLKDGRWNYIHQVGLILAKGDFDLCHFFLPNQIIYLKENFKFDFNYSLHFQNDHYHHMPKKILNSILENSKKIIVCSQYIKKVIQKNGFYSKKIHVVYNGVDLTRYQQNKLSSRHPKNKNFTFIFSGRIVPEKGIKELILAFIHLNQIYPDTRLVILGPTENTKEHKTFYLSLRKLVQNNPHIHWVGFIQPDRLPAYYAQADVFVGPSLWQEPLGIVFLEALASGLPIITTRQGGIPEIVKNNINGYTFKVSKTNSEFLIRKLLIKAFQNKKNLSKIEKNNLKKAMNFDWSKIGLAFCETLNDL